MLGSNPNRATAEEESDFIRESHDRNFWVHRNIVSIFDKDIYKLALVVAKKFWMFYTKVVVYTSCRKNKLNNTRILKNIIPHINKRLSYIAILLSSTWCRII